MTNNTLTIDKDLGSGGFASVGKKSLPKKPLMIIGGIIIIVIISILVIMFFLPNLEFTSANNINDSNNGNVEVKNYGCEKRINLNIPGITAIFANSKETSSIISAKGAKAQYIQLSEGKKIIEVFKNDYFDKNNPEKDIVALLKSKNVSAVAIANAEQALKNEIGKAGIKCYDIEGTIASLIGEEQVFVDESYCKELKNYNDLNGIIAFAANSDSNTSIVSAKKKQSPYFLLYEGNTLIETIVNTAKDSNHTEDDLITLLQDNEIDTVIMASFGDTLETKLQDTNLTCYEAQGTIISFVQTN